MLEKIINEKYPYALIPNYLNERNFYEAARTSGAFDYQRMYLKNEEELVIPFHFNYELEENKEILLEFKNELNEREDKPMKVIAPLDHGEIEILLLNSWKLENGQVISDDWEYLTS
jgi:hypothetical protein